MNLFASLRLLVSLLCLAVMSQGYASPDHDHDHDAPAAASSNGPKRRPDGSVFLPKPSQRQLGVRTIIAEKSELPQAFALVGKVVMDPNAGGRVQPMVTGRIEPGPRGLPTVGQSVRQGEVLAYVRPAIGTVERANQTAQAAELRAMQSLARKRVERLQQLEGTVPQKEIDAARAELHSVNERLAAISGSLSSREALIAPVTGVIAEANALAGQIVEARDLVFSIVDPNKLRIEAIAHDATSVGNIASASVSLEAGNALPLEFLGAGRALREQTIPVQFRPVTSKGMTLPFFTVGQPVKVIAQSKAKVSGVAVPASAVVRNASNQDIVWVHAGAEQFVPKTIRYTPLDATAVAVTDGLAGGERVVTQGASLVNQVR